MQASRIAAQLAGAADHPGDHRRLGEIAEGKLARPGPILRLVEHEIGVGGVDRREPQSEQGAEADEQPEEITGLGDGRARPLTHHDRSRDEGGEGGHGVQCCAHRRKLVTGARQRPFAAPPERVRVHAYFRCHPSVQRGRQYRPLGRGNLRRSAGIRAWRGDRRRRWQRRRDGG